MIVVDASVVLGWFIADEAAQMDALRHVEHKGGVIPGNFHGEVVHGLLRAERQRRVSPANALRALQEVLQLSLDVVLPEPANVMVVARQHGLTGYDASYLELARQAALPLATADVDLRRAAATMNLLWEPAM